MSGGGRPPGGPGCPGCGGHASEVKDSRPVRNGVRRRRLCAGCGVKYTTYEYVSGVGPRTPKEANALGQMRESIWSLSQALKAFADRPEVEDEDRLEAAE